MGLAIGTGIGISFKKAGKSWDITANAPTGLTATTISDTEIDLSWTDNSADEEGYSIERSTDGIIYAEIDTVLADVVTYSDTSCIAGTLYYYRVRAYKGTMYTNYSNVDSDTTISWEQYLYGIADLNTWIKVDTRNGFALPDTITPGLNDASILLPYLYKPTGNEYVYNTAVGNDFGGADFTVCGWVKSEDNNSFDNYFVGKRASGAEGAFSIHAAITTGYVTCQIISELPFSTLTIASTVNFATAGWIFYRMDCNYTSKKVRFFINENFIGEQTFGRFNKFNSAFYIGSARTNLIGKSSHSDTYIYNKILSDAEALSLYNGVRVTGALAHWPLNEYIRTDAFSKYQDVTGNNYHLTTKNCNSTKRLYGINGSKYLLNYGHSLYYHATEGYVYVGYLYNGTSYGDTLVREYTLSKIKDYAGNISNHNIADSLIRFALLSNWDRSNTTIWSNSARTGYYDAANPTDWHPSELNQRIIDIWLNTDYKDIVFIKGNSDSIYESNRNYLEEYISYDTVKTGINFGNVLKYTKDYDFFFTGLSFTSTQPSVVKNFSIVLIITSGYTVLVDFGDGTPQLVTGTGLAQTITSAYISAGTYTVRLTRSIDKITSFSISGTSPNPETTITVDIAEFNKCLGLNILHLEYLRGGYGSIELTCPVLQTLYLVGESDSNKANYYGSIDVLPSTMKSLFFLHIIDGQLEGTTAGLGNNYQQIDSEENMNFTIDLDTMGARTSLYHLCINGSGGTWSGSINSLVSASLDYISFNSMPNVTFDIGTIQNSVKTINVEGSDNGNISGNLNAVPTAVEVFIISRSTAVTGNLEDLPATIKRIAIVACPNVIYNGGNLPAWVLTANCIIDNNWNSTMVDAFLINAALNFGNATGQHIYLNYTGMGARTSASDAAVATLLGKGYTVHSN